MHVDKQLARVVIALCDSVSSPVSQEIKRLVLSDDARGLISQEIDPNRYSSASEYLKDAQCVNLLRKVPFDVEGVDRRQAAIDNFWKGESECAKTNVIFKRLSRNTPLGSLEITSFEFLERAKAYIKDCLGALPRDLDMRFGPGATFNDRGRLTTVPDKMTSRPTATSGSVPLHCFIYETAWGRCLTRFNRESSPLIVRGNRFTTVPKDAKKDRGICIEPSFNIALQLPIGALLKRKLKQVHDIDLVFGQDRHRTWAQRASRDGMHATLDLSNASDTVAHELVRYLLPPDWFSLLDTLRSPLTRIEDKWVRLEKFSSMGNGFTFELESLIFASLCFAAGCRKGDFSVFGDDLIVPTDRVTALRALLSFCGFTLNNEKSFWAGPFRESCGGDFFEGVPVRSHYLKELPHEPQDWIKLANGFRRAGCQADPTYFRFHWLFLPWLRCQDNLPTNIRRLKGPQALGDLVIHDDTFHRRFRDGTGYVRVYRPIGRPLPWSYWHPEVMYASVLYGCGTSRGVMPRDATSGYKIGYHKFS